MALERAVFKRRRHIGRAGPRKRLKKNYQKICTKLRQVQRQTGCATNTLNKVVEALGEYMTVNVTNFKIQHGDKHMCEESGAVVMELNGCVGCHRHVYIPSSSAMKCPKCRHPRFNVQRKPNEVNIQCFFVFCKNALTHDLIHDFIQVCWYFPIREQLDKILQIPEYRELLMHEVRRKRNEDFISDVYDAPRYITESLNLESLN